jgi:hypothetical protein
MRHPVDHYSEPAKGIPKEIGVQSEENPTEATSDEGDSDAAGNGNLFALPLLPYRQARRAMLVTAAVLALASVASVVAFGYQFYRFLATGGAIFPTTVPWSNVLGHLIRACGLGLICWRLMMLAVSVDAKTGGLSEQFAVRHRSLWRTSALVLVLLAAYAAFEAYYTRQRDTYGFFRPEFQSGFVEVRPDRIEIRRGFDEPVEGWLRMKAPDAKTEVFVSPVAEIAGKDIRSAMVRIAELYPGSQSVELRIQLTDEGSTKMYQLTNSNLTRPLPVLIDGKLRAAPRVFTPITSDAQITNVFTLEEAARMIREGSDR